MIIGYSIPPTHPKMLVAIGYGYVNQRLLYPSIAKRSMSVLLLQNPAASLGYMDWASVPGFPSTAAASQMKAEEVANANVRTCWARKRHVSGPSPAGRDAASSTSSAVRIIT